MRRQLKAQGIIVSGNAAAHGIGCMTDARHSRFFGAMVRAKLLPAGLDYRQAYTTRFVCKETMYWFNLVLDATIPVCGNASQRYHGQISNDGPKNLADSVEWIASRVWADEAGRRYRGVHGLQASSCAAVRLRAGGIIPLRQGCRHIEGARAAAGDLCRLPGG